MSIRSRSSSTPRFPLRACLLDRVAAKAARAARVAAAEAVAVVVVVAAFSRRPPAGAFCTGGLSSLLEKSTGCAFASSFAASFNGLLVGDEPNAARARPGFLANGLHFPFARA